MIKVLNYCKLFMWANIGTFMGRALQTYLFYKNNPRLSEIMSAPWYAELIVPLIITVIITVIIIIVRVILKKRIEKKASEA